MHREEDEIDIKALVAAVYKHKILLFLVTLTFALGSGVYAYFQPNIYQATASVKVGLDKGAMAKDVLSMAMGKGAVTEGTEKDLIQSRYLRERAKQFVDFSHHYYTTQNYKEVELYTYAPFEVVMSKGFGLSFLLTFIDDRHYKLEVEESKRADGSILKYSQVHQFDENVITDDFELNIMKVRPFHAKEYRFVIDSTSHVTGSVSSAQSSEHSTIFQISYSDTVPLRAQEFANALADAYVNQNVENTNREATQKLIFIKEQQAKVQKEIQASISKLESFRRTSKTVNIDNKMEVVTTRVDAYEAQLMEMNIKEEMLKSFYAQVKKGDKLETLSLVGIGEKDSALVKTMQSLQEAVIEKKILREDYTSKHPKIIKINGKIRQLKTIIIHTVENLMATIEKRQNLLMQSINKQKSILNDLPESERQYNALKRTFKMNENMNNYLLKMKAEAEMIKASTVSKNRVLDHALLPRTPISPKRQSIIIAGTLFGFVLGLVWVLLLGFLDDKIKSEDEIKKMLDLPIVGTIPHVEEKKNIWDESVKIFDAPKSVFSEAFRNLRSNLKVLDQSKGSKIILLTSTVGEEGKTTLSVNLAGIMSTTGKRTIIINMDMRKPTLHEKFNLPNNEGLSELLSGSIRLQDAIKETKYPYLDILPSGTAPVNPAEAILSDRMYKTLEDLKKGYEIIILDTPPIGLVSDAKGLMQSADINLYVLRANYSKKVYLKTLKEIVELNKLSNIGIVLNDVNFKQGHYGYYHNYGYYEE